MAFYKDLSTRTMVTSGRDVRAVGWLHPEEPFPRGPAPARFVARLRAFAAGWRESTRALGWGTFRGLHRCEFCGQAHMHGNFGVPGDGMLFVAPEMITHYVEAHRYAPPPAFVRAVLTAPLPGTAAYQEAVDRFRRLHRRRASRLRRRPAR